MSDFTLTILGATGYTGRLCVAEAVAQGLGVRLAGRRRDALDELAASYGDSGAQVSVAVADVVDRPALRRLAESSDVLLSTVGPYDELGRGVVEAAIAAPCPYLDVTGEVRFLDWVHGQNDRVVAQGVPFAPAVGFDGVPGDLLAALAAQALARPAVRARVAYHVTSGRVSAGTARTALGALARGGAVWRNGRVAQEPAGVEHWDVPFPSPPGPVPAVSAPLPEVVTLGRSIGAELARSYFAVPGAKAISSVAGPAGRLTSLLSTTPVWGVVERAVDRLPDGPSADARQRTKAVILAEVAAADGVTATRWARIGDVYGVTARVAVGAARLLAGGQVPAGVLTPSQLFDPSSLLGDIADELGPI